MLALLSLALVLSIADPPDLDRDSPPGPVEPLGYLPAAVVAALSVWYVMHWGQLHGWLEGPDITAAMIVGSSRSACFSGSFGRASILGRYARGCLDWGLLRRQVISSHI